MFTCFELIAKKDRSHSICVLYKGNVIANLYKKNNVIEIEIHVPSEHSLFLPLDSFIEVLESAKKCFSL